jgi:hypothetical protein
MTAPAQGNAARSRTDFSLNSVSLSEHSHSNLSFPHRLNSATNNTAPIQKFASNPNFSNGDVNPTQIHFYRRLKKISSRTPEEELIDEHVSRFPAQHGQQESLQNCNSQRPPQSLRGEQLLSQYQHLRDIRENTSGSESEFVESLPQYVHPNLQRGAVTNYSLQSTTPGDPHLPEGIFQRHQMSRSFQETLQRPSQRQALAVGPQGHPITFAPIHDSYPKNDTQTSVRRDLTSGTHNQSNTVSLLSNVHDYSPQGTASQNIRYRKQAGSMQVQMNRVPMAQNPSELHTPLP